MVKTFEFLEPLPTVPHSGNGAPMTDYNQIMRRIGIKQWVEQKGVKEVWIWGYHGGVLNLWESVGGIGNPPYQPAFDAGVIGDLLSASVRGQKTRAQSA